MITIFAHDGPWTREIDDIEPIALATIFSTCRETARLQNLEIFSEVADALNNDQAVVDFRALTLQQLNTIFAGFTALAKGFPAYNCHAGASFCSGVAQLCQHEALGRFDNKGRHQPMLN